MASWNKTRYRTRCSKCNNWVAVVRDIQHKLMYHYECHNCGSSKTLLKKKT